MTAAQAGAGAQLTHADIQSMFTQHAARLAHLEARGPIETTLTRSLTAYQNEQERALRLAHERIQQIWQEAALTAGSAVNIVLKTVCVVVAKEVAKEVAEESGKKAAQQILKKIPIIGVAFGLTLGILRAVKGDHWSLVAGEVASGAASCVPGWGTAVSISIDAAILVADVAKTIDASSATPAPAFRVQILNLNEAYACIGINYAEGIGPTRDIVDRQYRLVAGQYHPDRAAGLGQDMQTRYAQFMVCINAARTLIYQHRQWA